MDEHMKVENWTLDDGRKAEKRILETNDGQGNVEKVIELHIEELRPLKLQQRIVEKSKPVVYERKIETVDATGNVVEQKVEMLEPKVQLQLVEHIATIQSQSKGDASKEQTVTALNTAANKEVILKNKKGGKVVNTLGFAEEFEKLQQPQSDGMSLMDKILLVVIAGQVLGLGYILFFM